jgi:hypothetical protein
VFTERALEEWISNRSNFSPFFPGFLFPDQH